MKVFFTASQRGKKYFDDYYRTIYKRLEDQGCKHVDSSLIDMTEDEFYKRFDEKGLQSNNELYKNNLELIKAADVVVFECSLNSLSVGYMVEKALEMNKPTIALYLKDHIPYFLVGNKEDKLLLRSYTKEDLEKVVDKTVEEAAQLRDKRFNFFISPDLLTYLENASAKEGITKSAFLRNLLLAHRKKAK